jgi:predicted membrane protein
MVSTVALNAGRAGAVVQNLSGGDRIAMETRNKRSILTGGMIMIGLGVLIILSKMDVWAFSRSWPLLLIIIAVGTLIQRVRDLGGWVIGSVGLIFLISESFEVKIYAVATFLLPLLLILVGINVLMKYFRKNRGDDE